MKRGRLQAKDIDTLAILRVMAEPGNWFTHWDCPPGSHSRSLAPLFPPGCDDRLKRAKMEQLILSGLVSGCSCGCRGDYEITDKGRERVTVAATGASPILLTHSPDDEIETSMLCWCEECGAEYDGWVLPGGDGTGANPFQFSLRCRVCAEPVVESGL